MPLFSVCVARHLRMWNILVARCSFHFCFFPFAQTAQSCLFDGSSLFSPWAPVSAPDFILQEIIENAHYTHTHTHAALSCFHSPAFSTTTSISFPLGSFLYWSLLFFFDVLAEVTPNYSDNSVALMLKSKSWEILLFDLGIQFFLLEVT